VSVPFDLRSLLVAAALLLGTVPADEAIAGGHASMVLASK
jgi:hypothetical protein